MRYAIRASALVLVAAAAFLAGCAAPKEYESAAPFFNEPDKTPPVQVSDPDIASAYAARAQVVLPAEVALFEETYPGRFQRDVPQNEMSDRIAELLRPGPEFSRITVISPHFITGPVTPRSVRLAAAWHQAPLTLLCYDDFRVEVDDSPLVILNLTIIGAMIVPSTTVTVETRVGMHLIDTRNGHIYYSGIRSKKWDRFLPSAWGKEAVKVHREQLVAESYEELAAELKRDVARLAAASSAPAPDGRQK